MKEVRQDALTVISTGTVEGNLFRITAGQLDRNLYAAVNEALENLGGKWSRKLRGHVFEDDPTEKIDELLLTGKTVSEKQLYQFFETSPELAERLVKLADLGKEMCILEPSAGRGALLAAIPQDSGIEPHWITAVELDPKHISGLKAKGFNVWNMDFMEFPADGTDIPAYDRVIMNPPFTRQQDIDHVMRAWWYLNDGGRLVAIMSPGFTFRENSKSVAFRELVEENGHWIELPEGTFKDSGTMVGSVLVVLNK